MEGENTLQTTVAVIGAGHAGIEAALASARLGVDTVLFTLNLDSLANLPCNPSIGGTGKGHLVYEIDALGGEMGKAADRVTLQSRTLNLGKGAAVHSKRIQADRMLYRQIMKQTVENTQNLRLCQAEVTEILTAEKNGKKVVCGVRTRVGDEWECRRVIIAAGTYLSSRVFMGDVNYPSGPDGLMAAEGLSDSLRKIGVPLQRFKTGTPARIASHSIDYSKIERQDGEAPIVPFSHATKENAFDSLEQIPCHIVYTNAATHAIIRENLKKSAMYGGHIHGTGPRYCPSIEDKVVRFADKERHQLFVEPTGRETGEMYLQGFSTSMPVDVQREMLRTLPGFENARIMRYAYAIEYDCTDPTALLPTLEFKEIEGLYGAGQFNGSSGYEEAAAQGLVAGVNAALREKGEEPMILTRASSYIGTLIDDLVTKGTKEPYRIMTSRSEYRLLLRQDNADLRLTEIGRRAGLVKDAQYEAFLLRRRLVEEEVCRAQKAVLPPSAEVNAILEKYNSTPITTGATVSELLRRPELSYEALAPVDHTRPPLPKNVLFTAQVEVKYAGYLRRQQSEVERQAKLEEMRLSPELDYKSIRGLRLEAAQKLSLVKPLSLGQASRISGVNPADISVLLVYLSHNKQ